MLSALRRLKRRSGDQQAELRFDRPLLLMQSDDWGRVGVRDREGWEQLQAEGIDLGEKPYDFYTLETAEDLEALCALLKKHRDSVGRSPSMTLNFIVANVDFDHCFDAPSNPIPLVPLSEGLPGQWRRPRLLDAYRQGIQDGVFFPGLHGLTHFCAKAVTRELEAGGERCELIRRMWRAQTPYIHWRMPWIGYEYHDSTVKPDSQFLNLDEQRGAIGRAAEIYRGLFSADPITACAPGYRANADTRTAWSEAGVRVVQNGPGPRNGAYLGPDGTLHTFRNVEIELAITAPDVDNLMREADLCFRRGLPVIVSIHSINFHSTIRDNRTTTLAVLDKFLTRMERRWPDLLYVHDADLFRIATEGFYLAQGVKVSVGATKAGEAT